MRKNLLYGLLLLGPLSLTAQGQLSIAENTYFSTSAQVSIHIIDSDIETNGELDAISSQIFLTSSLSQAQIGGIGENQIGILSLSSPLGEFILDNNLQVNTELVINEANLNLGSYNILFPYSGGTITGETNQHRIYSNKGGKVIKQVNLNTPQTSSPGNLGLSLSSNDNLGRTEIHRIHETIILPTGESIDKSFEIYPEFEPESQLQVRITYFDSDGYNSDAVEIWKLNQNSDWRNIKTTTARFGNEQTNTAEAIDLKPTLTYTVGPEKEYVVDVSSIPTAFTPNNDRINDTFIIPFIDEEYEGTVTIINRWGDIIYSTQDYYANPWDGTHKGKALPVATYYYVLKLGEGQRQEIKGNISIVR